MMTDILQYLDSKNIAYRIDGSEAILKCPTCNKEKLYLNINSGVYQCFVCQAENPDKFTAKGHINQLKTYFGDIVNIELFASRIKKVEKEEIDFTEQAKRYSYELWTESGKKGLRYLLKRGFTEETIREAEFGFTRRYNQNWVSIPAYEDGIVKLIKLRKVPPYESECTIKEKCIREGEGKSILYNSEAINKYNELILCLHGDSLIDVDNNYIKIKDVCKGKVLTHTSSYKTIQKNIITNVYDRLNIIDRYYSPFKLKLTPNHKLLAARGKVCNYESWTLKCKPNCPRWKKYSTLDCQLPKIDWIKAEDLNKDDLLVYPIDKREKEIILKDFDSSSKYLWFLVGFFLGNGSTSTIKSNNRYYSVNFYLNIKNIDLQNKVATYCNNLGLKVQRYFREEDSVAILTVSDTKFATFLSTFYNEYKNKSIPSRYMFLKKDLQMEIVKGLFYSDGYFHKTEDRITNTSIQLLLSIQKILLRNDIIGSINLARKKGGSFKIRGRSVYNRKDFYHLTGNFIRTKMKRSKPLGGFIYNNYLFTRVKSNIQEDFSGETYNLTIKDDHSYCGDLVCYKNCEGEFDCRMLMQAGYPNAVGATVGAGTLKSEWYDQLILKDKLYLCFDSDAAGQNASENVWAERLGKDKCFNVLLPEGMDVNDYLLSHTKEDFDQLLKTATKFKIDGIMSLNDVFIEMYKQSKDEDWDRYLETPWPSLNNLLERKRGFSVGRELVLSGRAKSGKTTLALQMCFHFIQKYQVPCLFLCLEMPEVDLAVKIVQMHYNMTYEEVNFKDALLYATDLGDVPLYFGYTPYITPEIYYNTAKAIRDRYGVKVIVFDNIQLMVRTGKEEDMGKASKMFQMASRNLNIFQILISQPKKTYSEDDLVADDLKGTSALQQDPDYVIFVNRKRTKGDESRNSFDPRTKLIVDMSRYSSGGSTHLYFHGDRSKFDEMVGGYHD
jgi:KaiC/GvpD/RAD55 family RecA-like ATPase